MTSVRNFAKSLRNKRGKRDSWNAVVGVFTNNLLESKLFCAVALGVKRGKERKETA